MANILGASNFTGLTESGAASTGSNLNTGDLRRRYDFSEKISELKVSSDPFFTLLSKFRKESVDDFNFKFTEERKSWYRRYAYVTAHGTTSSVATVDATVTASNIAQGDTYFFEFATDYNGDGNIRTPYGQTNSEIMVGADGTKPRWIIPGVNIKIPFSTGATAAVKDYIAVRVLGTYDGVTSSNHIVAECRVLRPLKTATNNELKSFKADAAALTSSDSLSAYATSGTTDSLESKRCYSAGNSWGAGSGYPETWADNPYSTGEGQTEIFKTALGMDNSTRATVLKYEGNEFMRLWGNKMLEHKWDIENAMLFSTKYTDEDGIRHTQGIVDYALNYGHVFNWATTKTCDDFLEDLSIYFDPRTQDGSSVVHMVDTQVFNWLNTISGYHAQSMGIATNGNYRTDFMFTERGNVVGVPITKISTIHGDMNIIRNIHLDGSPVKILAVDLNYVKYRPLVGNGMNRDTAVYVGVQTLENTGVDAQVDLLLTEAGLQIEMPEAHAVWTI